MLCNDCSRADTCPPCVENVARDELFDNLRQWMHSHTANALIDDFAHALAEKQREWLRSQGYDTTCVCGGCDYCRTTKYIDLIDPKKTTP